MDARAWRPVLAGEAGERADAAIDHIATALARPPPPYEGRITDEGLRVSLASREPGYALFFAYLHRARPEQGYDQLALHHLGEAQERVPLIAETRPFFAYGLAGLAWAMEHVRRLVAPEDEDPLEEIDEALCDLVAAQQPPCRFGWRDGLAGYGVYALERRDSAPAARLLELVIEKLRSSAETNDLGCAWRMQPRWLVPHERQRWPEGACATTMPDGAIAPLLVAARAAERGVPGAAELHRRALRWLLAQRAEDGRFPPVEAAPPMASPAWFGGQLGVTAPLLLGAALDEATRGELEGLALDSLTHPGVPDASLADGHAGLALLAMRLGERTGDQRFVRVGERRLHAVMEAFDPRRRFGFTFRESEEDLSYLPELAGVEDHGGLVRGAAGIGLVLLSARHPLAPDWDRSLLIAASS